MFYTEIKKNKFENFFRGFHWMHLQFKGLPKWHKSVLL